MATQKRRRRKKSGKYTPLVWLFTGALIAFFISFSNSLDVKKVLARRVKSSVSSSSSVSGEKKSDFLIQKFLSSSSSSRSSQKLFVFLAKKTAHSLQLFQKPVRISENQTPLRDVLEALLSARPEEGEYNLIPYQTEIRKVWIKDGIAYIDFNEAFNYNSYGYLGYQIQLYQVVYTATQFPSVKAVYFYMNGRPMKVIGGEGFLVNNPVYPYSSLPSFSME